MQTPKSLGNSQIIILGICIALALIAASLILSSGMLKVIKFAQQTVDVTGSAQKNITSNYIVWRFSFSRRDKSLPAAYQLVLEDLNKIQVYLTNEKVAANEINIPQVSTRTVYLKNPTGYDTNTVEAYEVIQTVEVSSSDIPRIDSLAKKSMELINQGIDLQSNSPEYYYTKLDELKVEMLTLATQNAKLRAATIVKAAGNQLSVLRSARMGVFQITPATSTEVSDYGYNDTSSLEKKVMAVVSASFAIE